MNTATTIARNGWGRVHPNPLVGAVVLRGDETVGVGWHAEYGGPHAERIALDMAGERAHGATLITTLEPCAHHGKQPPCVDVVLAAGIRRVIIAIPDPHRLAAGGIALLRAAGVEVVVGPGAPAVQRDNFRFLHAHDDATLPFVAVKLAVSMDGFIADHTGSAQWISGEPARAWVHWLRAGFAAIGVGATTVRTDDARLTVRGSVVPRIPPIRVIFDRSRRLEAGQGIFQDASTVPVVVVHDPSPAGHGFAPIPGVQIMAAGSLRDALVGLGELGVDALLVEGGGRLAGALLAAGLVDRVYQVLAPIWLGDGVAAWQDLEANDLTDAVRWEQVDVQAIGDDTVITLDRP